MRTLDSASSVRLAWADHLFHRRRETRRHGFSKRWIAENDIRGGQSGPGYTIEQGEGRQRWVKSPAEVAALGDLMGIKLRKDAVVTPKQAIKAGLPETVVAGISDRPVGEWKLAVADCRAASKVFGK